MKENCWIWKSVLSRTTSTIERMNALKLVYSDGYYLPIGAHVFPAEKYRLVHARLLKERIAVTGDFVEPKPASDEDILLVHTPEDVSKVKNGTLSPFEEAQM